jgi:hypothetical protein
MAFDFRETVGEIADDLRTKAQEMLDSSQVDDRIAHAIRKVSDALAAVAGRVDDLDTDETDDEGNPEPDNGAEADATDHEEKTP